VSLSRLDYERFFDAIMATIPSSILVIDAALTVVHASRNFLEKSHATRNGTIGRRLQDIFPEAFRDTALAQQVHEVIRSGRIVLRQRMSYRAPAVPLRIYSYSICPLPLDGGLSAAILVMDDVTDLLRLSDEVRQAQLHLASVVESAGDLIISTDACGRILTWNGAAETACGFSAEEMRGRSFVDLIAAPQKSEAALFFAEIAKGDRRRAAEWPMRRRKGEAIPVSWNLSSMTDSSGEVTGIVVVGRNLVEQRALEAQIHQAEKLAALGMVIGGIAHEIRNPLGVSSAAAQLLKRRGGSKEMREECVQKVIGGIARASAVVENLLRFARPSRLGETVRVDVVETLRNALMFASGEAAAGTTVAWEVEDKASPLYAEGVQNLVELVLINLIANAFQAMPDGGRLSLAVRRAGPEVLIEIGDTGNGITESDLPRIFDPFFTTRTGSGRSGLGLALSHSIVRQHGGSIAARSRWGAGTHFTVRLPCADRRTGASRNAERRAMG
jgi:PAS domain S-box-containing protein